MTQLFRIVPPVSSISRYLTQPNELEGAPPLVCKGGLLRPKRAIPLLYVLCVKLSSFESLPLYLFTPLLQLSPPRIHRINCLLRPFQFQRQRPQLNCITHHLRIKQ